MASARITRSRPLNIAIAIAAITAMAIVVFTPFVARAQQPDAPPPHPRVQATTDEQSGQVHLTWNEIPGALAYQIWYGPTHGSGGRLSPTVDAPQAERIFYGLQRATEYRFHVMVKVGDIPAEARWSLWSQAATTVTPSADPNAAFNPTADLCDRPHFAVNRIKAALDTNLTCQQITASHLSQLTVLDLSQAPSVTVDAETGLVSTRWLDPNPDYQGPIDLQPQDLAGLSNVTILDISGLGITHLTPEMFAYLPQLTELRARRNQIRTLPAHVFAASPNLSYIDLSYNQIDSIAPDAFTGLTQLEVLDLDYNQIESMHDRAITNSKHPHLQQLSLILNPGSEAQLASLPVRHQANAQGVPIFVCLMIDQDRQCVNTEHHADTDAVNPLPNRPR